MRPKIVSVKALQARQVPPPSQDEWIFVEMHGEVGGFEQKEKIALSVMPMKSSGERKDLLGWLKGFFGS